MNPEITKIIDQYLANELSPADKATFEERINSNPELKAEIELQRSVNEAAKRASQRTEIKKVGKNYHWQQLLKWGGLSLFAVALITTATLFATNYMNKQPEAIQTELRSELDKLAQISDLPIQYFQIPEDGSIVMSDKGVLISVPKNAFLFNGKPYSGKSVVQFQEAMDASDIIKAGLSTMSGDRLLETQGMFGVNAFTDQGEKLTLNPKVGVYIQAPVDEYKNGMQLFEGVKNKEGLIDWQNPKALIKIPVPVDMSELDFYPEKYEPLLDKKKWKQSKDSRDSLYLSFEEYYEDYGNSVAENYVDSFYSESNAPTLLELDPMLKHEGRGRIVRYKVQDTLALDERATPYIPPSNVLAFWKKKFNNTNLSTRAFEGRMREIHETCNKAVLKKYTSQLDKPLSQIDQEVVDMGFPSFEKFVAENMGKVEMSNPHLKNLQAFYEKGVNQLKSKAKRNQDKERNRQDKWDKEVNKERQDEVQRTIKRETQALVEEFEFNMKNVKKQIGPSVGFTLNHGGGTVVNIDKYVWDATVARKTTTVTDPFTGKTATITYNDFSFEVPDSKKYIKLYGYVFPHQLNSYQRISGKNGKFDYPLNDDIIYDIGIVGVTEDGYEYFQKQTFKSGELGTIKMERVTEQQMEASIQQLNKKRINKPARINEELKWLMKEQKDFKEQKMRQKMRVFRSEVSRALFPCMMCETEQEYYIQYN